MTKTRPPCTAETVFDVASLTKVVATTAAAMLLYQRGLLDLETPLGELLPGFVVGRAPRRSRAPRDAAPPAGAQLRPAGLRGVLPHRHHAGALLRACLELPLEAEPGTRAEYSDPGFILLGKALEVLTGESLASWAAREIFRRWG